ncbi:SRPBCC family protein [Streptomyces sp. NPDC050145]|uniref:SRPBCC family protein n=1 Tax=Streptomyces sp. NPDC050145 TaxID=3365602 RepID=UPI0037A935F7
MTSPQHTQKHTPQQTLTRSVVLPAAPADVWSVIGEFHGLGDWHPYVPPSSVDAEDGDIRVFAVEGKVVARERLLAPAVGPEDHAAYTYTVLDPMLPITDYVATLAVRPHAEGSEVVWSARYRSTEEAAAQVESVFGDGTYGTGLAALQAKFG